MCVVYCTAAREILAEQRIEYFIWGAAGGSLFSVPPLSHLMIHPFLLLLRCAAFLPVYWLLDWFFLLLLLV
jgi:hypothetical protein